MASAVQLAKLQARPIKLPTPPRRLARPVPARHVVTRASAEHWGEVTNVPEAYGKVCNKLRELSSLEGIAGLLSWDEMVMMPAGAAASRGAQKAALEGVLHDKRTDAELGHLLHGLWARQGELDRVQASVVREARREYVREAALPKELATRLANLKTEAYSAWVEARKHSDFGRFAPYLRQLVDAAREKAAAIDPSRPPYDVLLEEYEKGCSSQRLDAVFAEVREGLVPLLEQVREKGVAPDASWLQGEWDVDRQADICKQVALDLGFNTERGRLDVSVHPFTGGAHPTDVRMTTRFSSSNIMESITGAVHETGHALYEQGRNPEWDGLPVGKAMSMGVHESQSLLWERMVGLSVPFCRYLLPRIRERLPEFPDCTAEELHHALNHVQTQGCIRVEADELTYPLHIIVRYEIERALIDGSLQPEEVPSAWSQRMQQYLGVTPHSDAVGCLQDIHWSMGAFGYFPTYSLGAMYACQIFRHAATQIPDLHNQITSGNFTPLREWLNERIHRSGSLFGSGDELMEAATGAPLQPQVFLSYLKNKYTSLYQLPWRPPMPALNGAKLFRPLPGRPSLARTSFKGAAAGGEAAEVHQKERELVTAGAR